MTGAVEGREVTKTERKIKLKDAKGGNEHE